MSRRFTFAGKRRDGSVATTAGYSKGIYVTPDLMLIDADTAAKVDKKQRAELEWIFFRSKREAKCWIGLRQQEKAGLIRNLQRQVKFELQCPTFHERGELFQAPPSTVTTYAADFVYDRVDSGEHVVADAKGFPNDTYPLKKKWMKLQYGIEIQEV